MGDFDGDLVFDLAVGASGDADGGNLRGAVYILFMNANGTVKSEQKISDTEGGFSGVLDNFDQFGVSVAGMGDLDGDLVSELAVGAFGDADGGASRGAVWILFMNPGTASTADLSLAKSDSPDPVAVGSSLAYTLTVTNESPGPGTATGVVVTDTLPTGVTFKSAAPSQGTVDPVTGAEVVWNVGDLVQGQSETLEILVTIDSTTLDGAVLTNTAVVAGGQPDPVSANDTVEVLTTAVVPVCTLELSPSYLTVNVLLGANVAVTANLWGTVESEIISIFIGPAAVTEPPINATITAPLPPSGTVGILATLTLPGLGIICSDFKTVDTGAP